jgi:DNA repair exonuclease SbcCD ATPase subunit
MLKEIRVRDLGPIKTAIINTEAPVTLILGPNESGKTTLIEALMVLYFGTRGDVSVAGNAALTHAGAKGWKVEAVFDDGEILSTTRATRATRTDLAKRLGDPRVFQALCHVKTFLEMKPAERKQLVADLSAGDTLELANKLELRNVDSAIVKAVRDGNTKRAHTLAVEERRALDRKLNALVEVAEAAVVDTEITTKKGSMKISEVPLATVDDGLLRLRKRRDEIGASAIHIEQYERAQWEAAAAQADLDELTAEASWGGGDSARLLEIQKELTELRTLSGLAAAEIRAASELQTRLEALAETGGDCPTCLAPLKSLTAQAAIKDARDECSARVSRAKKVQKANADAADPLKQEEAELGKRKNMVERLSTTRARLEAKVKDADVAEPEVPKGDLGKLDEEITRLVAMRDARRAYDALTTQGERAQKQVEHTRPARDKAAALVDELDPSVVSDESAILTEINGHLARTCGKLGVPVVLNDGYDLSIHGRQVGLASDSARLRAGFGVACALSVLSGSGLAFLDRFEALDEDNRKRVLGLLKGLTDDGLLSMVLIGAVKKDPVKVGNVPWLASVGLKNGTATYLGAKA